ncbi:L,D-transpeptidase YcbB [hydrothermal vent metagenome]|uniref:L,D-transpeptidase YcbB n=1 Tax=hydrothermal vent metagenome TaxID=652676 RepID=A0A1W1BV88_9ZZZZ
MKQLQKILIALILIGGLSTTSAFSVDFDSIASKVITKVVSSQPSSSSVKKIYQVSQNRPIWVTSHGFTTIGRGLLDQIGSDPLLDHNTKIYRNYESIVSYGTGSYFGGSDSTKKQIKLELKMTNLYRNYANYKIYGMINWKIFRGRLRQIIVTNNIHADWLIYPKYNIYTLLYTMMITGDVRGAFDDTTPKTQLYVSLEKIYFHYRKIASSGEWPTIPRFGVIKPGESNAVIPKIRKRLYLSGDLQGCDVDSSTTYDSCLVDAVKRFQKRVGERPDGVIGKSTQNFLRLSLNQILTKMQLNLDRIRVMRRNSSDKHIMINIPAFKLYFYNNGKIFQTMKVIVGKKNHPTPVFSNEVKTVVLNPYWNVPKSIIQKEMIPKLLRNPNAMVREGIEIRKGWGADAPKVSGASVDWSKYRYSKTVPYHFAQVPGYRNALGKIKFLFPNQFSVYMHDTPTKHLFKRKVRSYSHGCIRLEKPRELMKTFASFNDNLDYSTAQKILKGKKQTYYSVEKVPVDVTYLTAWVDPDGILQMRNDIYGYDKEQLKYRNRY